MTAATRADQTVMRGITNREHRKAIAERREAQASWEAAHVPTPSRVGWDSSPPANEDPASTREAQRIQHLVLGHDRPKVKVTEGKKAGRRKPRTVFRPQQLEPGIEEAVSLRERWSHKANGTPETWERAEHNEGHLTRLWHSGAITSDQLSYAVAIARVAERIGADVTVRTASLETRLDGGRRGSDHFYEALGQVRAEVAYSRWRLQIAIPAAVLDMLVGAPVGITVIAKRYRMHHRRARQLLVDALDLWPRLYGDAVREVDEATLAAAHAGILS